MIKIHRSKLLSPPTYIDSNFVDFILKAAAESSNNKSIKSFINDTDGFKAKYISAKVSIDRHGTVVSNIIAHPCFKQFLQSDLSGIDFSYNMIYAAPITYNFKCPKNTIVLFSKEGLIDEIENKTKIFTSVAMMEFITLQEAKLISLFL